MVAGSTTNSAGDFARIASGRTLLGEALGDNQ
jgi:hypothetical protein